MLCGRIFHKCLFTHIQLYLSFNLYLGQECESLWEYSSRHSPPAATNLWRVSSWELSPTVKLILITLLAVQSLRILNQLLDVAVHNEWIIKVEITITILLTFTEDCRLFIVTVGWADNLTDMSSKVMHKIQVIQKSTYRVHYNGQFTSIHFLCFYTVNAQNVKHD